jgi:uncharacterized protein YbjQ (UPF0145 family)
MWICKTCGERIEDQFDSCWKCANNGKEIIPMDSGDYGAIDIPISTTPAIPGRECVATKGIVCGEAIMGANVFRDILASITDVIGGRSGAYEGKLREARVIALSEMAAEAKALGADGVVGVDIDYETIGQSMLMVTASGTAVTLLK